MSANRVIEAIWTRISMENTKEVKNCNLMTSRYYKNIVILLNEDVVTLSELIQIMFEIRDQQVCKVLASSSYNKEHLDDVLAAYDQLILVLIADHTRASCNPF